MHTCMNCGRTVTTPATRIGNETYIHLCDNCYQRALNLANPEQVIPKPDIPIEEKECVELTPSEYQHSVVPYCAPQPTKLDALHYGLDGLNGEAGEALDILKKHIYQGHDLDKRHLLLELGDVAACLAYCCEALDISMEEVMRMNLDKLSHRYPEGHFTVQRSVGRAADDI